MLTIAHRLNEEGVKAPPAADGRRRAFGKCCIVPSIVHWRQVADLRESVSETPATKTVSRKPTIATLTAHGGLLSTANLERLKPDF